MLPDMPPTDNLLYYGDNLDVLRRHVPDESVDLVYLDPPFNSNQNYNVLFAEKDGTRAAAQIRAFEDTWEWDEAAAAAYQEAVEAGGKVAQAMLAFRTFLGDNDMLAYLAMMAPRLVELRRVLKSSGSLYLHCDPTASHYLKMLLDAVFGPEQFRSEVIWKRSGAHNSSSKYGPLHDTILFYSKSEDYTWNAQFERDEEYIAERYTYVEPGGRKFYPITLHALGTRHGESGKPWRGIDITAKGGHWKYGVGKLDDLEKEGRIYWPANKGGMPRLKVYAEEAKGAALQDIWDTIPPLNSQAAERLGYPTQKPEALLERIIKVSSAEGATVLDPFCGCGTTVAAAQKLGRRWIGIDVTHLAIALIKTRLRDTYGANVNYQVVGEPTTVEDAEVLAASDPYQFQWWALGLVGARPAEQKKGADKGIDGRLYFHDGTAGGKTHQIILSVKAGHVGRDQVHSLGGVMQREKAEMGVLLSFEEPTKPMRQEAASAGLYESPWGKHPRIQLLTVGELLEGKRIDYPQTSGVNRTYKQAPKAKKVAEPIRGLFDKDAPAD